MSHLTSLAAPWAPVLASGDDPLSHVIPHELSFSWAKFGDYTITNHVVHADRQRASLLLIVMPIAARAKGVVPTGFRNLVEAVLQFLREDMARPALGQETDKFIPFIWTMFFLILTANLLGMIPLGAFAAPIDVAPEAHRRHGDGQPVDHGRPRRLLLPLHPRQRHARCQGLAGYWQDVFLGHAPVWLCAAHDPPGDRRRARQAVRAGHPSLREHDRRARRDRRPARLRGDRPRDWAARRSASRSPRSSAPCSSTCWSCSWRSCRPTSSRS